MEQKNPVVLGVKCSHPRPEHANHWVKAVCGQSALGLLTGGAVARPLQTARHVCKRSGASKSILGSYASEFPLGDEAAFGIVEQYLNTCGEKSNIRVGTESL